MELFEFFPSQSNEKREYGLAFLACCLLTLLNGCSDSKYGTAPVEGTVSYAGKEVTWGSILFTPKASAERTEGAGRTAVAGVDEQGNYRLSTYGLFDGALTGTHGIQFQYSHGDSEINQKIAAIAKEVGQPVPKVLRPATPTVVVEPGNNQIDIELVGSD